jgi:orotidine-5'-phosphate decarboxylase
MQTPDFAHRDRLVLALDVDDLVQADRLVHSLRPWFGVAKVGLELFSAAGPEAIGALRELGVRVFLDLKLHDIPTTVERAGRVLGALGVDYLTLHASGGEVMLRAGVEGLRHGAAAAGLGEPCALGVTILTSESDAPGHVLRARIGAAVEAGCGGIVCSATDLADARQLAPRLLKVVPGIRPEGTPAHDQARAATPTAAIAAGADLLVIGRAVTAADDPVAAARALAESLTIGRGSRHGG